MTLETRASIVSNILTTVTARVFLMGLALVSSVVLARALGPEGRGLFALVFLLPEWARSLGLIGFEQANAVYAGLEPHRRRALVWQSIAVAGVVGGALSAAAIAAILLEPPGIQTIVRGPVWLYVLALAVGPVRLLIEYWSGMLRGMNHILLLNAIDVGTKIFSLSLVVTLVVGLRYDVAGAVWADALTMTACAVLLFVLLRSKGAWGRPVFDWSLWKRTTRFALPAHGGTITAYVNYRVGEFIIAALLSPQDLAFYVIAVGLVERLWLLAGAVGTALLPHLTNTPERDAALPAVIARHVILWTGVASLLVGLFADFVIELLYSTAYAPSVAPLRWLLPGIFALSVGKVLVAELLAREKPSYTVWASGIAALVNLGASLVLIPQLGISGAALASSISYTLLSLIITWLYLKETGVSWAALLPGRRDLQLYVAVWQRLPGLAR